MTHLSPLSTEQVFSIITGKLFDSENLRFLDNQIITVSRSTGLIRDVAPYNPATVIPHSEVIDLRHLSVLPGFVDVHVHLFLHAYSETSWDDQVTKESIAERVIRATIHAKRTLLAGFTTVRGGFLPSVLTVCGNDLGTEGAGDADIGLRKCLAGPNPMIPGPRYFTANRAIVAPGSYGPRSVLHVNKDGVDGATGAEVAGGVDACVNAVRRQIGAGADWIKIYGDYRTRARTKDVSNTTPSTSFPTFTAAEVKAMVDVVHQNDVKVAMHANTPNAAVPYIGLVDSIEHGAGLHLNDQIKHLCGTNTTWVPTLSAYYTASSPDMWAGLQKGFKRALQLGMDNIACGGDTGVFNHGQNALEMKLMVRLGADYKKVLQWGTLGGWKCIRPVNWQETGGIGGDNDQWFGLLKAGWAADLIAVDGDLDTDFEGTVDRVMFVMKGAKVYKLDGKEVNCL